MANLKDRLQATVDKAKGNVEMAAVNAQDALQTGPGRTQEILDAVQEWLHIGTKHGEDASNILGNVHRQGSSAQAGLTQAQVALQGGLGKAQDVLSKQSRQMSKGLMQAQKKLGDVQDTVQESMGKTRAKTMDVLSKSSVQAGKGLSQASENMKDMRETLQENYEHYQRRRQRARRLFRIGLVAGVILALLYTPKPGAEMRNQLFAQWQTYRERFGF